MPLKVGAASSEMGVGGRGGPSWPPPAGFLVTAVGVAGTALASFLPWARSGERLRNSYELIDVVGRLELIPVVLVGPSRLWSLLPLAAVLTCIAVFFQRPWCTTVLSLFVGLAALGLVVAVVDSPLGVGFGAWAATLTGVLSAIGALNVIARQLGRRRDRGTEEPVGPT
ncbi:MAG: hypothetical protein WD232_03495 [Acidimicrobiales bacterium]